MPNLRRGMMAAAGASGGGDGSGNLWGWGRNESGNLGNGTSSYSPSLSPVQSYDLTDWIARDADNNRKVKLSISNYTAAIKTDGTLWTFGAAGDGRLGNGTTTPNLSSPVQIGSLDTWDNIIAAKESTLVISTDGTMWAWGANGAGQLMQGNTTKYSSPVQVGSLTDWKLAYGGGESFHAIKTDGTLWAAGVNGYGVLGTGNTDRYCSPVQIGSLTNWEQVDGNNETTGAVKTDGTLWTWGNNALGQLGNGGTTDVSSPVQVGSLTNWYMISVSVGGGDGTAGTMMAVKTDGTLWGWGSAAQGQQGHGNTTTYSSPVQVGSLTDWRSVQAGNKTTMADTTAGTLFAWGEGLDGLGNGNTTDRSSPVQVQSYSDVAGICGGSNGIPFFMFIRS